MNRRAFLAGVSGVATGTVAGCLSAVPGITPPPDSFEQCDTLTIPIEWLPDPAENETETAYTDGQYETDDELYLPHVIDIESTYLEREHMSDYFLKADVESRDGVNRLTLSRTTPSWGERSLDLENDAEGQHTVEVRVSRLPNWERDDTEVVIETTVEIDEDETIEIGTFERTFGEYSAEVTIDGMTDKKTWEESSSESPLSEVTISQVDGGVELEPDIRPESHMYGVDCDWDA